MRMNTEQAASPAFVALPSSRSGSASAWTNSLSGSAWDWSGCRSSRSSLPSPYLRSWRASSGLHSARSSAIACASTRSRSPASRLSRSAATSSMLRPEAMVGVGANGYRRRRGRSAKTYGRPLRNTGGHALRAASVLRRVENNVLLLDLLLLVKQVQPRTRQRGLACAKIHIDRQHEQRVAIVADAGYHLQAARHHSPGELPQADHVVVSARQVGGRRHGLGRDGCDPHVGRKALACSVK